MSWTYDIESEEIRDSRGVIGRVEPASGPLAATAPEILAACEAVIDTDASDRGRGALEAQILAAIAKARGCA